MLAPCYALLGLVAANVYYSSQLERPDSQVFLDQYSILKKAAGFGPYSPRSGIGLDTAPPDQCVVDQVVLWHRHGERYPDEDNSVEDYEPSLKKIQQRTTTPPEYGFLDSWEYYANSDNYGEETSTGTYNGLDSSQKQGAQFRVKYEDIFNNGSLTLWASSASRVVATAQRFAQGFNAPSTNLKVIEENDDADSLTPVCKGLGGTTCDSEETIVPEFDTAASRFNAALGTSLNGSDIANLMYVALFEINVRGNSPWLQLFTSEEWTALEYIRSYRVFCKRAHGSPNGMASGSVLTNATVQLLNSGPSDSIQPITMAFVHDTQISNMIGAMALLNGTNDFVPNQVTFSHEIQISEVVPMGANLVFERLRCQDEHYVRVVLNEAVVPIGWCNDGPGYSCQLSKFTEVLDSRYGKLWPHCKLGKTVFKVFDSLA